MFQCKTAKAKLIKMRQPHLQIKKKTKKNKNIFKKPVANMYK